MQMYNVLDIAKYIIFYCRRRGYLITNLKLQKLLYFIQAEFLVSIGAPCFNEEIEAWDFGPVVPEVYHEYKSFGNSNIILPEDDELPFIRETDRNRIKGMVDEGAQYSASDLVRITHNQAPWKNAYKRYYNNVITKDAIQDYFTE